MNIVRQKLFREPDGRAVAFPLLFISSIGLLAWGYIGVVLNGSHFLLGISTVIGFGGITELLPPEQRRLAGILRILGISVIVVFLGLLATNPELLV
jgi:hypothetical protein